MMVMVMVVVVVRKRVVFMPELDRDERSAPAHGSRRLCG